MKKALKILAIMVGLVVIFFILALFFLKPKSYNIESHGVPQFITADYVELDKIGRVSKFRSGAGHDFSDNFETCRSMKHYHELFVNERGEPLVDPQTFKIFSPMDGKIVSINREQTLGDQIYIKSDQAPEFTVRLFHVKLLPRINKGSQVKSGQQIGTMASHTNVDIAVQAPAPKGRKFVSYFDVMTDQVFAAYQKRGVPSQQDFILTKEYRDAHPLQCNGERFVQERQDEWVDLVKN